MEMKLHFHYCLLQGMHLQDWCADQILCGEHTMHYLYILHWFVYRTKLFFWKEYPSPSNHRHDKQQAHQVHL